MNKTNKLIDYVFNLKNTSFSDNTINQVRRCLLDYIGVTLAGAKLLSGKTNNILDFAENNGNDITPVGISRKTDVFTASFINGFNSHVAELDDGSRYGAIHPGSPIFSVLLPLAKKEQSNYQEFIKSVVIAYEVAILLSTAIQPSHYNLGYHPTSTCGSIGAALGAGILLDFNKKQLKDTFSAAAISSSGTLKVIENGSELKPYNTGNAALNGLMAALTGRCNFNGPEDVLSGDTGFLSMMSTEDSFIESFKHNNPLINNIYVKPYAACRHAHPSIEAALKIRSNPTFDLKKIKKIKVKTYKGVIGKHDSKIVTNQYSSKMSIPFSIALAIKNGSANIDDFSEENLSDKNILSLMDLISIEGDDYLSELVPNKRVAILEVEFENGKSLCERIDYPKGEPENPMSDSDMKEKFLSLAKFAGIPQKKSNKILELVWSLEESMNQLFEVL